MNENRLDKLDKDNYISHRLVMKKSEGEEVRCVNCNRLLYKVLFKSSGSVVEVKCSKCGKLHRGM